MSTLTDDEVLKIRADFPALDRYVYFTTNGLGVVSRRVAAVVRERVDDLAENAVVSAIVHNRPVVSEARERAARLLGCDPQEIAFCRNTSEGVLWAASSIRFRARDEILLVQGEYPANVLPWMAQEPRGVTTRLLRQRERRITPAMVAEAWSPHTRLLAVSFVQYNSGFRADLRALAEVVHARGGLLFCDAIQGLGALCLDVRASGVDCLGAGTHKWLLGLQGLGIFYCRRELLDQLAMTHVGPGGLALDHDPEDPEAPYDRHLIDEARRFEEGSRNYVAIAALSESLRLFEEVGLDRIEARIHELTEYVVREVQRRGCRIESPRGAGEWSGILLFAPPAGAPAASDIVAAMHGERITINAREGCIHMGVHFYNTRGDIERMLEVLDNSLQSTVNSRQ